MSDYCLDIYNSTWGKKAGHLLTRSLCAIRLPLVAMPPNPTIVSPPPLSDEDFDLCFCCSLAADSVLLLPPLDPTVAADGFWG